MSNEALHNAIRRTLRRGSPLTVQELAAKTGRTAAQVRWSIKRMPDTYIVEWEETSRSNVYAAVWGIVQPPADAPKPSKD